MSKLENAKIIHPLYCKTVKKVEDVIVNLTRELTYKDYCIYLLKVDIRLLHNTLTNVKRVPKDVLYQHESINNALNARLENRYHLKYNGDEIYYVGEEMYLSF